MCLASSGGVYVLVKTAKVVLRVHLCGIFCEMAKWVESVERKAVVATRIRLFRLRLQRQRRLNNQRRRCRTLVACRRRPPGDNEVKLRSYLWKERDELCRHKHYYSVVRIRGMVGFHTHLGTKNR